MEWNSVSDTEREESTSAAEQIDLSTAAEQSSEEDAQLGGPVLAEEIADVVPNEERAMHVVDETNAEANLEEALDAATVAADPAADAVADEAIAEVDEAEAEAEDVEVDPY
jgi:transcriptional antiterminator NusG